MRMPSLETGIRAIYKLGIFHHAMIGSDSNLQELVEPFSMVQNRLKDKIDKLDKSEADCLVTLAKRTRADNELDKEIRLLEADLFRTVERNKKSSLYQSIFPKNMSWVVRSPLAAEIEEVKRIETNLEQAPENIKKYKQSLKEKRESLEKAMEEYNKALREEADITIEIKLIKMEWIKQYELNYADIIKAYPGERPRVESYFKKFSSKHSSNEIEETEQSANQ